jgi:hypothetical protein
MVSFDMIDYTTHVTLDVLPVPLREAGRGSGQSQLHRHTRLSSC